jgi:transglutaminase-like putative cysteine protease/preprotein translocase subunit SecE
MTLNNRTVKVETVVKAMTYAIGLIGFLSVVRHIGILYALAFVLLALLSVYLEYKKRFLMPRWFLNVLALAMVILTVFRADPDDPVLAIVEALLILVAIKLLEEKRFRDHMQIYLLTMLLLTGSALLSIDIIFLLYFISLAFLLAPAIVMLTYYSQDKSLELRTDTLLRIASKSLLIPLLSMPMTIFMFIILPRTSYPLLGFLSRGTAASSGFTDNISLGKVSSIQEDATVIFRAQMGRVHNESLYWRGIVLDSFDGTSWKRLDKEIDGNEAEAPSGKQITQTIYLEPYENSYLFAMDKPVSIAVKDLKKSADLTYSLPQSVIRRIKYTANSVLSDVLPAVGINKDIYLKLSDKDIDRIKGLVKDLTVANNKEATTKAILRFLKSGNYSYSLKNLPVTDKPLEDFLFAHRYGNCEYFASAMAVMLRAADIPSRVVGGYRGGYYNEAGNYYLVSQKNAHVWVEAHIEDKGWVRFDPTPAGIEGFTSPEREGIAFRARLLFDAIQYHWNAMIINYDFKKQMQFFYKLKTNIKNPKISWTIKKEALIRYSAILLTGAFCVILLYRLVFRRRTNEEKMLGAFLRKMERHGYRKSKSEGLEEFVSKITDARLKEKAYKFVRMFEEYFYKDNGLTKKEMQGLKKIIEGRQ